MSQSMKEREKRNNFTSSLKVFFNLILKQIKQKQNVFVYPVRLEIFCNTRSLHLIHSNEMK